MGEAWSVCVWVWGLAKYGSRSWSPGAWTLGPCDEVVLGDLLEAWRSGLGVWNVVGVGLVRVCLGLGAGPVRVPVLVPWGLDLGALI